MKQNWTYKKFSEVFNLQMGKTPSRDNLSYWGGDNIWVSIADMKGKYIDSTKEHITDFAVSESKIHKVPQGTAIMSFKLTIGRAAIAKCDLFTNEAIMSFEPKDANILLPDYVFYYLKGCKWAGANKAVMGQTLNKKTISENTFAYPPLSTQSRIVSELDLLQSVIDKQKAQLKELETLAQAIFYDMFGDPVENEKGWEVKEWGELFDTILGKMLDAKKQNSNDEIRRYLGNSNVQWRSFDLNNLKTMSFSIKEIEKLSLRKGDVLICEGGESGRCAVWEENNSDILFQKAIHRARVKTAIVEPHFIPFLMEILRKNNGLKNYVSQATIEHLTGEKLNKLSIIHPPLSLQQTFAQKIEAIERQKKLINQSIAEAQTLFDSRMEYYFG